MKIILGLGNPGEKYVHTRHNVGFDLLDKLRKAWDFPDFQMEKKFEAEISKGNFNNQEVLLIKPQTFMNLSGETVQKVLNFYKLTPNDILVIHDDLDIKLGEYRLATDSSSAGHNGVQNIIDKLGTQKFQRLRIGIGRPEENNASTAKDYVLDKFSKEEKEKLEKLEEIVFQEIKNLLV